MTLVLDRFGFAFGDQVVVADISLTATHPGTTLIMGPAGGGKTSLFRTLAGLNDPQPSLRVWGDVKLNGLPLTPTHRPLLVHQKVRLLAVTLRENLASALPDRASLSYRDQTERLIGGFDRFGLMDLEGLLDTNVSLLAPRDLRRVAIFRALLAEPDALMVDEPMAGLSDEDAAAVLELLRRAGEHRILLLITHHQQRAKRLGGTVHLLVEGYLRETAFIGDFLSNPSTDLGRQFVNTGRCLVPGLNSPPDDLTPSAFIAPATQAPAYQGPRGFYWLFPNLVGGSPRPGIVSKIDHDLDAIQRLGITHIINLEESVHYETHLVASRKMTLSHNPIPDMGTPSCDEALKICRNIQSFMDTGCGTLVHCRAGLGRTGLVMALFLIWCGKSAPAAFEAIRNINPKWIQSDIQFEMLPIFVRYLESAHGRDTDEL